MEGILQRDSTAQFTWLWSACRVRTTSGEITLISHMSCGLKSGRTSTFWMDQDQGVGHPFGREGERKKVRPALQKGVRERKRGSLSERGCKRLPSPPAPLPEGEGRRALLPADRIAEVGVVADFPGFGAGRVLVPARIGV